MPKTLKVAGMEVEPGKIKKRMVKVGELTDSSDLAIPVIVVNGTKDGPTLILRDCGHGSEYAAKQIVRNAALQVDPSELSGAIIASPSINPLAYNYGTYKNIKSYDLSAGANLPFPGSKDGTYGDRVSYYVWNELFSKGTHLLGFHDGATHWIARYITTGYSDLAKIYGVGLPIGRLEPKPPTRGFAKMCEDAGISRCHVEFGGTRMLWKEDVENGVKGINNVMKHIGMIKGDPEPSYQIVYKKHEWLRPDHGGVLIPAVSPLKTPYTVGKGETIATITNMLGDVLEVIESPFNGVVFCARTHCAVHTGDWLYGVGKID